MTAEYDINCSTNRLINFGANRKISICFLVESLKVACKTRVDIV